MARNEDDIDMIETIEVDDNVIAKEKNQKLIRLPLGRVKQIIKMDPDVAMAGSEAVFLIAKATVRTELFFRDRHKYISTILLIKFLNYFRNYSYKNLLSIAVDSPLRVKGKPSKDRILVSTSVINTKKPIIYY